MTVKRIQVLSDAEIDLHEGRAFYDKQGEHVGDYFFDSLLSDIESLRFMRAYTRRRSVFTEFWQNGFPMQFITISANGSFLSLRCSLCEEAHCG